MAEVLGVISAAVQLIDGAIEIIKAFKKAYDRQQNHENFLEKYRLELVAIRESIQMVEGEKGLATPQVLKALKRLEEPEKELLEWLRKVDRSNKKAVRRFVDQLIHGKADRKRLDEILAELNLANMKLNIAINVASAGRTHRIEKMVTADNAIASRRSNGTFVDGPINPGRSSAPRQHPLRRKQAADLDSFNDSGISSNGSDSESEPAPSLNDQSEMERTITNNFSDNGSIMVNARIGGDTYKNLSKLTISNNKADNRSLMLNYPNEKEDLTFLVELQMRRDENAWRLQNGDGRP